MKARAALWVVAVLLLAGGCSPGWEASLPHSTRPILKIGLVAPFEGRYRSFGYDVLYAVRLAVRQRNAAGGVAGYMVELVALNDDDDPAQSAFQAHKFAVDPGVAGVVGPFSEAALAAAAPVYRESGLAMVTPATCPPSLAEASDGGIFCLGAGVEALERALLDRLPAGARPVLVRSERDPLGDRLALAVDRVLDVPSTEAGYSALLSDPADVYLFDGDALSAADFLIRLRGAGVEAPVWGGPLLARAQLPQVAGDAAAGACYVLAAPLLADLSPGSSFVAGYQELAGAAPGPWAALAYDAATLLLDVVEKEVQAAGAPAREGVIARLREVPGPDGRPVFEQGQRREVQTSFYCYGAGEPYPGHAVLDPPLSLAGPSQAGAQLCSIDGGGDKAAAIGEGGRGTGDPRTCP